MQQNLVEVLLPVRSPAPWLRETLLGLREQTYQGFTLRVLLHGPGEDEITLVRTVFPTANIDQHSSETSFSEMLNLGLKASRAKYIARIDADDIPKATRFECQLRELETNSEVEVVASSIELIDSNGNITGRKILPKSSRDLLKLLRWKNVIAHPSVMFDRQLILDIGGYSTLATHAEDYDLWLRVASRTDIKPQAESLTLYRLHTEQVSRKNFLAKSCIQRIAESRRALAASRNESGKMAWVRQIAWATPQFVRRVTR